ncbi:MAG: ParB/RepB/Spo0J family partition protein [Chloroflexi bacterium]|nr:ParB/RepB/Spo0J family partition protein [Chloroflexota bacterium]
MQRRGLGRGLGALIPAATEETGGGSEIHVDEVSPNPNQPRRRFDERSIAELATSIKEHGVIQPIIVRQAERGYEIVAGERRWRAAQAAGLQKIPAIIRMVSEEKALEVALIENIQREDLNPIDEATAYRRLMDECHLTQDELADKVGKSRSAIANQLRLLNLPDAIQGLLQLGALTAGHARTMLALDDEQKQLQLAEKVASGGLSVRQTETLAKVWSTPSPRRTPLGEKKEVAQSIGRCLGARVKVKVAEAGKGRIEIHFNSLDELERLSRVLAPGTGAVETT